MGCESLKEISIQNFVTNQVKNMNGAFDECSSLEKLDLSNFETPNLGSCYGLFYGCRKLKYLDISKFIIRKKCNTAEMFALCESLHVYNIKLPKQKASKDRISEELNNLGLWKK